MPNKIFSPKYNPVERVAFDMALALASKMETAVLLVDYRLGPQYKFPVAIEDCFDAFLWAREGVLSHLLK